MATLQWFRCDQHGDFAVKPLCPQCEHDGQAFVAVASDKADVTVWAWQQANATINRLHDELVAYRAFVASVREPASGVQTIANVTYALAALSQTLAPAPADPAVGQRTETPI